MQIISSPDELQRICLGWRAEGYDLVLVPTMGYLHAGHQSLLRLGRKPRGGKSAGSRLIASIFVNPSQFAPNEDLATYPRDLPADTRMAEEAGVDLLFIPDAEAMYPQGYDTWVDVPGLSSLLCGASRPIHFKGVCTVVLKLFMLTCATHAIFGRKDRQQLVIIRRMARDLNLPVSVEGAPIVRESDGLALSSRNKYLNASERAQAPHIYQGLLLARALFEQGETGAAAILSQVGAHIVKNIPSGSLDYLTLVHPETLIPIDKAEADSLLAVALRLGKARLIDNIIIGRGDN